MKTINRIIEVIKSDFENKTSTDRPVVTGNGLQIFLLRLLLGILGYVILKKIIPSLTFLEFVLIDLIFNIFDYIISIFKRL